jgi:hypothetical protein|tara:strand:+ start:480 stop:908 length:429 start_codon:yes stop_codon:yes gene_type:complete
MNYKIKENEIIDKLNGLHTELEVDPLTLSDDPFSSYDASNDTYIVEIKSRDRAYDSWIIEYAKYEKNIDLAIMSNRSFIYLTELNGKIMTWNINRLIAAEYNFNWQERPMPGTTEFLDNEVITKKVGYLYEKDAKKHTKEIL